MAARTRSVVCGVTFGSLLTTRDTVLSETPAARATSLMLTKADPFSIRAVHLSDPTEARTVQKCKMPTSTM